MDESLTESLNAAQREAVCLSAGPALILAGAGSGKTRVITHRIAWLIAKKNARPDSILAMTFTNRAAREMRERVDALCRITGRGPLITTFHSACARWLRTYARNVGLQPNFSIYDPDDVRILVKGCAQSLAMPYDRSAVRGYLQRIDAVHNAGQSLHVLETAARTREEEEFADLFCAYQVALQQACAVDFGTLITSMLTLLEENETVRTRFRRQYQHVLVDEFQDTNAAQYRLLRALAPDDGSVMVVGDDDQSIYGWRGADVENVRRFVRDYQRVHIVKLEENYRSIAPILDSAHTLVEALPDRMDKQLRAVRTGDAKPILFVAYNDREEAAYVAETIHTLRQTRPLQFRDFAIFYRTNAQSRVFEQQLRTKGIPHRIVGNVGYFDRREVRDILAWLRLISNPADDAAFMRVRSTPPRGIGDVTLGRLLSFREEHSDWRQTLAAWPTHRDARKSRRSASGIAALAELLEELHLQRNDIRLDTLIETLCARTGYLEWLEHTDAESFEDRARNIDELIHLAGEISRHQDNATLEDFLERVSLDSTHGSADEDNAVQLMTVHTAKGLEFPVVFVTGLEAGIFPFMRRDEMADRTPGDLGKSVQDAAQDEERRLAYVAITRAQDRLFLSAAQHRQRFGHVLLSTPSTFLEELHAADLVRFDPHSTTLSLDWHAPASPRRADPNDAAPPANFDDNFDQRPWDERDVGANDEDVIPEDGVIFDERYFPESSVEEAQAWIGRHARHKLFGTGEIVDADPTGDRVRLTIRFLDVGLKKVIADYVDIL